WAEEHCEEMREVDCILYRSDEQHNEKAAPISLDDAEAVMQSDTYADPDAFLPDDVRDRLYEDRVLITFNCNGGANTLSFDKQRMRLPRRIAVRIWIEGLPHRTASGGLALPARSFYLPRCTMTKALFREA
ncbi:MAG: hypothetical protein Q4C12_09045, partial [Clostridia bacterium]|nr:hypothetical protein [Clostridia bacterium]